MSQHYRLVALYVRSNMANTLRVMVSMEGTVILLEIESI